MKAEDLEKLTRAHKLVMKIRELLSEIELREVPSIGGTNIYYMVDMLEEMDADLETILKRVMPMYRGR